MQARFPYDYRQRMEEGVMMRVSAMITLAAGAAAMAASCGSSSTPGEGSVQAPDLADVTETPGDVPVADQGPEPGPDPGLDPGPDPAPDPSPDMATGDAQGDGVAPPCCKKDSDCTDGLRCVGAELPDGGSCVPAPAPGSCYAASDCPDKHFCSGADACSCTMSCVSEPGECLPLPGGCCKADADCDPGYVCAKGPAATEGVCEQAAPAGRCWRDLDCLAGQTCEGEKACPCDADCSEPDRAGTCFFLPGCCLEEVDCGEGDWTCVPQGDAGVCKAPVGPSTDDCWWMGDCGPDEACFGATLCPCNADCNSVDQPGKCKAAGCCLKDTDCGDGRCVGAGTGGKGVCRAAPQPGRCWTLGDCKPGETCHGAAWCPCGAWCAEGYDGPGVCEPEGATCVAIPLAEIQETCDAASLVIFDGTKCVATCPGCCGCGPWCDLTFTSLADCGKACAPASCLVWDGVCVDGIPKEPWWVFDGVGCEMIDTCICEGCPGEYSTKEGCEAACVPQPISCTQHGGCPPDMLCMTDPKTPGASEWETAICGVCGNPGPCHCRIPKFPQNLDCSDGLGCKDFPCGPGCDDCPQVCPMCVHGWCAYQTGTEDFCLCNPCA